jgi:DNA-binding transcriptional regulator YhcF (GntR family)
MITLDNKISMLYDAKLSVEDNAARCEVSVPTINLWIRRNGVDRLYDSMYLRYKTIKQMQKQHPAWSVRKIADEAKFSINTVRKYMAMDKFEKSTSEDKISTFDTSKSKFLIKTISDDQQEILNNIIKLYTPKGIQCDFTHSKGVFYRDNIVKSPQWKFDKFPEQCKGVLPLDDVEKYIENDSLHSCIVDLPFLVTKKEWTKNCKMHQRFNSFENMKEATEVNKYMLKLSYEKLKKKGIMIMKTQDIYTAGHQIWFSYYVHQWAVEQGFKVVDMFILTSDVRMLTPGMNQKCARKYHSYFFVFKK